MSGPLRSEDNDPRPQQMTSDPDRYFGEAWERSKAEVLAEQARGTSRCREGRKPSTLCPGMVSMSLRGDNGDVERLVAAMRGVGVVVWRVPDQGLQGGRDAGYRYFTIEVPLEALGG